MFLSSYTFTGPRDTLLAGWHKLAAMYGPGDLDLHVCLVTDTGIQVLDACPDLATAEGFSSDPSFAAMIASCDLPAPTIGRLGEIHAVLGRHDLLTASA